MPSHFKKSEILALLKAGQYQLAHQQAQAWLTDSPADPEAKYIVGVSCLHSERLSESIELFQQALNQQPDNVSYLTNLGIAYLRSGQVSDAISTLEKANRQQQIYEPALYNLGCACLENNQTQTAIKVFTRLLQLKPDNTDYLCALADSFRATNQWARAIKYYRKTLCVEKDHLRAHANLGPILMHMGCLDEALKHCQRAVMLEQNIGQTQLSKKNLGDCYMQMERLDEAMESYADAYDLDNDNADLCAAIGRVWLETNELSEACSWFEKAQRLDNDCITATCGLAMIDKELNRYSQALARLKPVHARNPENIDYLLCLADILWDNADTAGALECLYTIRRLQPQRAVILCKIAQILASTGAVNEAVKQYLLALKQAPLCVPALSGYATMSGASCKMQYITTMLELLNSNSTGIGATATLHSGLAYYYDDAHDYERAATHMQQANKYQRQYKKIRGWRYNRLKHQHSIDRLIKIFSLEYFRHLPAPPARAQSTDKREAKTRIETGINHLSDKLIFIVSMPRSGTTLVEQILSSHKNILGIGEQNFAAESYTAYRQILKSRNESRHYLPEVELDMLRKEYLSKIQALKKQSGKPDACRVVDKLPDNYKFIGWITTLFPAAKIIHVQRNPKAVSLSCWKTQFGSIRWANHEKDIVHRITQYQRIMQHWRKTIPERLFELHYENLVANQEEESRRLLDYTGLEWDENCMTFQTSEQTIRTASVTQVRKPLYTHATSRWSKYENLVPELFRSL